VVSLTSVPLEAPGVGTNALVDVTHVAIKDIGIAFAGVQPPHTMVLTLVSEERML